MTLKAMKPPPRSRAIQSFLRDLMMHAAVGTALGGVCTMVGEPQNLVIAQSGWQFAEFWRMSPVSIPVLITGLTMVVVLKKDRLVWLWLATP